MELNSLQDLTNYIDQRQSFNQEGGGAVDITQLNVAEKFLTYLFRPTFFEATTVPQLASAFDNAFFIMIFLLGAKFLISGSKLFSRRWVLTIYSLSSWLLLASTTANLGIAVRQKWMILPAVFMIILSAAPFTKRYSEEQRRRFSKLKNFGYHAS